MSDIPSFLDTAKFRHLVLEKVESVAGSVSGFTLPAYNGVELSNFVAADKPQNIVLKQDGTIVATLALSYDGSNNLTSIVGS
jgi:hypothetical protein